jgi:hypothetical protein
VQLKHEVVQKALGRITHSLGSWCGCWLRWLLLLRLLAALAALGADAADCLLIACCCRCSLCVNV